MVCAEEGLPARGAASREDSSPVSCPETTDATLGAAEAPVSSVRQKAKINMADPVPSQKSQSSCACGTDNAMTATVTIPGTWGSKSRMRRFCLISARSLRARPPTQVELAVYTWSSDSGSMLCIADEAKNRSQSASLLRKQPSALVFHLGPTALSATDPALTPLAS